jgi:small conductance mechanosensitive channel
VNWWRSLSLEGIIAWLTQHGLAIVAILVAMFVVLWLANRLHRRAVVWLSSFGDRGSRDEQDARARTLVGVLHNALRTTVYVVGILMLLEEIDIPIAPLLGSVAVVGLAVAFGTQSLIKDYFTGFLVLMEQQYLIGDVVRIGAITGQVEKITLRLTVLRDLDGAVHFIPHGQITVVSNLTHGWSQAVIDVQAAGGEHVERVRNLVLQLAAEMRGDERFQSLIIADAIMLGVEAIGDTTFTLRFCLRTLPQKRWDVKRELLRRIKERFQQEDIKVIVPA